MDLLIPEYGLIVFQTLIFILIVGLVYLTFRVIKYCLRLDTKNK